MDLTAADPTSQWRAITDVPAHVLDAARRVRAAGRIPRGDALVAAGMGGSAIGAALAIGAIGERARIPMVLSRGYRLPRWIDAGTVVLCSSYSGETEETLEAFDHAARAGARVVVATTGGTLLRRARERGCPVIGLPKDLQPRAAVGYAAIVALEVAAAAEDTTQVLEDIEPTVALLEDRVAEWGPQAGPDSLPWRLARGIVTDTPVVYGAELTASIAYRWKCQFNENSKMPAFWGELPEVDHNELVAWPHVERYCRFSAIFLDDDDIHPRVRRRIEFTADLVRSTGTPVHILRSRPGPRLARLFELVLLGDLVSLYCAYERGVDPVEIDMLTGLKARLAAA